MKEGEALGAPSKPGYRDLVLCAIAGVIAALALCGYRPQDSRPDEVALGPEMRPATETWEGIPITLASIDLLRKHEAVVTSARRKEAGRPVVAWLGNSQLHTINQNTPGDHLAPYWLAEALATSCPVLPLGISLPNASLQEHLVVALWAIDRLKVDALILPLVFDDLRETGLRDEFSGLLDPGTRRALADTGIGRELLERFDRERRAGQAAQREPLAEFVHEPLERWLEEAFSNVVPLWGERATFRAQFLLHLYYARNALFGIKSSTIRRVIPQRKELNVSSLTTLLAVASARRIPVVLYVAPIRNDVPLPYDGAEYRKFIGEAGNLAKTSGARFVNLEDLVPASEWGSYHGDDVDFMHFRGAGHRMLAEALAPEVARTIGCR
jgi:hypothetical protein